jgi:hypothetical protein
MMAQCVCGNLWSCPTHPWKLPLLRKKQQLKKFGLRCKILVEVNEWQFLMLKLEIHPDDLWLCLRLSTAWAKHISVCYVHFVPDILIEGIKRKWHGVYTRLEFDWFGSGNTAFIAERHLLYSCRLLRRARRVSGYVSSGLHISF